LETIDNAIEYGEIAIDKLSLAVKRADFLNGHPEQQLVNIEQDLKQRVHSRALWKASRRK